MHHGELGGGEHNILHDAATISRPVPRGLHVSNCLAEDLLSTDREFGSREGPDHRYY